MTMFSRGVITGIDNSLRRLTEQAELAIPARGSLGAIEQDYLAAAAGIALDVGPSPLTGLADIMPGDSSTTFSVAVGSLVSGWIKGAGDQDWFSISSVAGQTSNFALDGSGGTPLGDAFLRLYDSPSTAVNEWEDHRIVYGEIAGDTSTIADLTLGGAIHQAIGFRGDTDWFRITLVAGQAYQFILDGSRFATPAGDYGLLDPFLRLLDSTGVPIVSDDDSGPVLGSAIFYTAPSSGEYYLEASYDGGFGGGHYLISAAAIGPDVAASTATTAGITIGTPMAGELGSAGDHDWYHVTLTAGQSYAIIADGLRPGLAHSITGLTATTVTLRNSAGGLISTTSNNNPDVVHFTPSVTGVYYVDVGVQSTVNLGPYTVVVLPAASGPDIAGTTATTATLALGQTAESALESAMDSDWFAVNLTQGETYWLATGAPTSGHVATDTDITLRDSTGSFITSRANLFDPFVTFSYTAPSTGVYYVDVGSGSFSDGGNYSISFYQGGAADPVPATTATTASLDVDGIVYGNIDTGGDHDWYRITLEAGRSYEFYMRGEFSNSIDGLDGHLRVLDANGNIFTFNDDGVGFDPLIRFTPTQSGIYYLDAGGFGTAVGEFELSARAVTPQNPLTALDTGQSQSSLNVSVYFATMGQFFDGLTAARNWTAAEVASAMLALEAYANITNLTFAQTMSSTGADFVLVLNNLFDIGSDILGVFDLPLDSQQQIGGFNHTVGSWSAAGLAPGGLGFVTLIHEFGHGLGLAHPHEASDGADLLEGVTEAFDSYGLHGLNQGVFTTMTYNDGWPVGVGLPLVETFGLQATPMALDIAVLQAYYGANTAYRTGADSYVLPTANNPGAAFIAIWDAGGVDEIVHNDAEPATIDLRAATLLHQVGGGGYVSYMSGVHGGFTIAAGVLIENASGGSGSDFITGNEAANTLEGNAGDDLVGGLGGNDLVRGGEGHDLITGDAGADVLEGGSGDDTLEGGAGADTLSGGDGVDTASYANSVAGVTVNLTTDAHFGGEAQGDVLSGIENMAGSNSADFLSGDADVNALFGGAGGDQLFGFAGSDTLDGGAGADQMFGGEGDDLYIVDNAADFAFEGNVAWGVDSVQATASYTLGQNIENLTLLGAALVGQGNSLANVIVGNATANTLFGFAGNDTLNGGAGIDQMFGGLGDDIYVVDDSADLTFEAQSSWGTDVVQASADYQLGQNIDNLVLVAGAGGLTGRGNLLGNVITGNEVANTLFGFAGNDTLDGGQGADQLYGREGDDTYIVDNTGDVVAEANAAWGTDTIQASVTYFLAPNLENLTLTGANAINGNGNGLNNILLGNAAANTLFGFAGNDMLDGGQGADALFGGEGDDVYIVDHAGDVGFEANAAWGTDLVQASVSHALGANLDNLTLTGASAIDGTGNAIANFISGNLAANALFGLGGADTLAGGAGNDALDGGTGDDAFVYAPGSGSDTVTGFIAGGAEDTINLSAYNGTGVIWTITQVGADTVFAFSNGDQITLLGVNTASLVQTDPFGYA